MSTAPPSSDPSRRVVTPAVVGALTILALAGTALAFTSRVEHTVDDRQTLATPARLVVHAGDADVSVAATTRADISIHRSASWSGPDVPGRPHVDAGGVLHLDGCRRPWWKSLSTLPLMCRTRYELEVPSGTAVDMRSGAGDLTMVGLLPEVTVRGGAGTLDLRGVTGTGTLTASVGSGDVILGPGGRTVTASAGSGDIRADGMTAARVRATSGSGSVSLVFARAPDDVVATTGSGDVTVRLPLDGYRITARTDSGSSNVDQVLLNGQSERSVTARSGSGDVRVKAVR